MDIDKFLKVIGSVATENRHRSILLGILQIKLSYQAWRRKSILVKRLIERLDFRRIRAFKSLQNLVKCTKHLLTVLINLVNSKQTFYKLLALLKVRQENNLSRKEDRRMMSQAVKRLILNSLKARKSKNTAILALLSRGPGIVRSTLIQLRSMLHRHTLQVVEGALGEEKAGLQNVNQVLSKGEHWIRAGARQLVRTADRIRYRMLRSAFTLIQHRALEDRESLKTLLLSTFQRLVLGLSSLKPTTFSSLHLSSTLSAFSESLSTVSAQRAILSNQNSQIEQTKKNIASSDAQRRRITLGSAFDAIYRSKQTFTLNRYRLYNKTELIRSKQHEIGAMLVKHAFQRRVLVSQFVGISAIDEIVLRQKRIQKLIKRSNIGLQREVCAAWADYVRNKRLKLKRVLEKSKVQDWLPCAFRILWNHSLMEDIRD